MPPSPRAVSPSVSTLSHSARSKRATTSWAIRSPGLISNDSLDRLTRIALISPRLRSAGVQIEALIEYVALFQQGDETIGARKALLIEQRDQLVERMAEMQRSLDRLNDKIERYDQGLMTKEHLLRHLQSQQSRPD